MDGIVNDSEEININMNMYQIIQQDFEKDTLKFDGILFNQLLENFTYANKNNDACSIDTMIEIFKCLHCFLTSFTDNQSIISSLRENEHFKDAIIENLTLFNNIDMIIGNLTFLNLLTSFEDNELIKFYFDIDTLEKLIERLVCTSEIYEKSSFISNPEPESLDDDEIHIICKCILFIIENISFSNIYEPEIIENILLTLLEFLNTCTDRLVFTTLTVIKTVLSQLLKQQKEQLETLELLFSRCSRKMIEMIELNDDLKVISRCLGVLSAITKYWKSDNSLKYFSELLPIMFRLLEQIDTNEEEYAPEFEENYMICLHNLSDFKDFRDSIFQNIDMDLIWYKFYGISEESNQNFIFYLCRIICIEISQISNLNIIPKLLDAYVDSNISIQKSIFFTISKSLNSLTEFDKLLLLKSEFIQNSEPMSVLSPEAATNYTELVLDLLNTVTADENLVSLYIDQFKDLSTLGEIEELKDINSSFEKAGLLIETIRDTLKSFNIDL
ncbi:hypothetical protein TVAG_453140 [Trichomonas vaginalis G3]|uniref:Uncharacterized protein n=1 Tax=Trichomonas vaginalis (strain ATCC PRA-98 / G3) TaxID=412133 RepID=A2ES60_TRIV3|nr:armadillo (ARM) repeat-containing protein family [Trichomonas vaginalis G3]EAY04497.1 hypothetical protein TVAG_453140 [Trichomonas vaginalis G3]KAI5503278.1 armadillo (ARM) repeat-containing protein family [Trichomonas vaginalis G3]|eukprot:XP_001316720.1 hypothetical protein [Trichomonas vaginalis G3]